MKGLDFLAMAIKSSISLEVINFDTRKNQFKMKSVVFTLLFGVLAVKAAPQISANTGGGRGLGFVEGLLHPLEVLFGDVGSAAGTLVNGLTGTVESVAQDAGNGVRGAAQDVSNIADGVTGDLKNVVGGVAKGVNNVAGSGIGEAFHLVRGLTGSVGL